MCDTFLIHAHQEGASLHNSVLFHNMCHKGGEPNLSDIDEVCMCLPRSPERNLMLKNLSNICKLWSEFTRRFLL